MYAPSQARPISAWHVDAEDEHGWTFTAVVDVVQHTATIVLNDLIHHKTRIDAAGHFEVVPRWLPGHIRSVLEQRILALGRYDAVG